MIDKDLESKVAVVTGAAGTIGTAACVLMAARGARIVAVDRADADFSRLQGAIGANRLCTVIADVVDEAAVAAYAAAARAAFGGRIDVFFNNAGVEGPVAPIGDYTLQAFRAVMAVNVEGVFLGLKHVLPVMMAQGAGSVINTSSIGGLGGAPGVAGYIASKHAVVGLTRAAAMEAAPLGVRVNAIAPGPIRGGMIDRLNAQRNGSEATRADSIPARRYGTAEEVAGLVAFLASDASRYVNGAVLTVDGGIGASV